MKLNQDEQEVMCAAFVHGSISGIYGLQYNKRYPTIFPMSYCSNLLRSGLLEEDDGLESILLAAMGLPKWVFGMPLKLTDRGEEWLKENVDMGGLIARKVAVCL